jgi:4-amino-4-deoxy-L-arabinose transferase-like glycosyltransferase
MKATFGLPITARLQSDSTRNLVVLVFLLVISSFTFFWRLGGGSLHDWDEGLHAQMAQEMMWRGDAVTPYLAGSPHFTKPPLYYWLTILSYRTFGVNEFAARSWPALAGVGVVLLTYLLGRDLFGRAVGMGGALLLLIVSNAPDSHTFNLVSMGRMAMMTTPLAFFSLLALWFAWRGEKDRRYLIALGLPVGAAFMTKNVAVLVPVAAIVIYWLLVRPWPWRQWPWKEMGLALGIAVLIAAPWHLAATIRYGRYFWNEYAIKNIVGRVTTTLDGVDHHQPFWFYLGVIRLGFSYAAFLLPIALPFAAYRIWRKRERAPLLLLAWFGVALLIYSSSQTKLPWYIQDSYPALALLLAWFLSCVLTKRGALVAIAAFMILFGWRLPTLRDGAPDVKRVALALQYLAKPEDRVLVSRIGGGARPVTLFYAGRPLRQVGFGEPLRAAWGEADYLLTEAEAWQAAGLQGEIVCQDGAQLLVRVR